MARYDVVVRGGIENTLVAAGLSPSVADQLDDAFVSRVDLFAHLANGQALTLWMRDAVLVGARLSLDQRTELLAALYDGPLAPHGFYDSKGRAMTSAIRARPVALRRITSRFGERFDGITRALSMHHGIDYGVPLDTPVLAVGRGRVAAITSSRDAGKFIKLAHAAGYESLYLHLDRFAPKLHVGNVVAQGDIIAFSGDTGRSTGPHLHYELHLDGTALDPLATLPPTTTALGPMARREHLAFLKQLEAMHDRKTDGQDDHPRARP